MAPARPVHFDPFDRLRLTPCGMVFAAAQRDGDAGLALDALDGRSLAEAADALREIEVLPGAPPDVVARYLGLAANLGSFTIAFLANGILRVSKSKR